jgi:type II secretory pathway pseudopilin PulG
MRTRNRVTLKNHRNDTASMKTEGGFQLIEVLVSVVISGVMMAAIMSQLMSSQRFTTTTKNQVMASDIMQEIVDNARNLSWNELIAKAGSHTLRVNQFTNNQANDDFFPRPLIQDQANLVYTPAGQKDMFRGDVEDNGLVTATITNLNNGSVELLISVNWREGSGQKNATARTTISQTGIHN